MCGCCVPSALLISQHEGRAAFKVPPAAHCCDPALHPQVPLLAAALSEARLFQLHQLQRWQAGLPLQRGWMAGVYDAVWWASLGGSTPHVCLLAGLLLPACWDFTAFFTASAES